MTFARLTPRPFTVIPRRPARRSGQRSRSATDVANRWDQFDTSSRATVGVCRRWP